MTDADRWSMAAIVGLCLALVCACAVDDAVSRRAERSTCIARADVWACYRANDRGDESCMCLPGGAR